MRIKKRKFNTMKLEQKFFSPKGKKNYTKISLSPSFVASTSECTRTIPHSMSTEMQVRTIVNNFDEHPFLKKNLFEREKNLNLNSINDRNINIILDDEKSPTLTKKLSLLFNSKTYKILQKPLKKEKKYNNFRQKIIKDFSDETTMSKVKSTKSTFRQFMDYLENREAERINFAKEIEKRFYQTKLQEFTRSSVKKFIPSIKKTSTLRTLSVTQNDFAKSMNDYEKYERNINKIAGKSLADAIFDMDCPEYEEIKHGKAHKETNGINLNNLERKIKLSNINKYSYDIEDDVLLVKNAKQLKNLIRNTKQHTNFKVRNNNPHFIKKQFSQETIKKYREFNGVFFGLPV